ncbi:MAG: tetratricopeptide repeat protein [Treponema sp.]|uniref:tetratricopeptide repeat protein n=1 Tax=Treponema sp. TaxID=166 RepID=UPI0025E8ABE8|nr:tetratricopeptide repeat protein [Treponema sp.]MBR0495117.1 tetratricopeptide repeat protein [Treponema sp.]
MKNAHKSFLVICITALTFFGCTKSNKAIIRMQKIEEGVSSPTTEAELKEAIAKYQQRVADNQIADSQVGIWYKMLAVRYLDAKQYGNALQYFQKALQIYPANQNLFYYVGLCAGYMAKASLDYGATGASTTTEKYNYLKLAESAYLRAIELEPKYGRALYGLGILYVFELDQSEKAIPHLEKLLSFDTRNFDAMFVLARAYYIQGDYEKSASLYDKIASQTKSEQKKQEALSNKKIVLDASYSK